MTHRILPGLVALVSVLLVACYPYPENPPAKPKHSRKAEAPPVTASEQAKINEQEAQKKAAEETKKLTEPTQADPDKENGGNAPVNVKKPEAPKRVDYEFAKKAPGKDGFVLSPYNNKIIDVRDNSGKPLPRGTLVSDPTYAESEKKYFRVP
jgi:hypothetical protein